MIEHLRRVSRTVIESLTEEERVVFVMLYADGLRVSEVSVLLDMPSHQVTAIAEMVQLRIRMAIANDLEHRAIALWDCPQVAAPSWRRVGRTRSSACRDPRRPPARHPRPFVR